MKTKFAETQADFFRIVRIRTEVFVIEQQVDLHIEQDQDDDTAMHWLVENEAGEAVACCRGAGLRRGNPYRTGSRPEALPWAACRSVDDA